MIDKLKSIEERYNEIQVKLQDPDIVTDVKKMTDLMKEMKNIEDIVSKYGEYKKTMQSISELKELHEIEEDEEMLEMVKTELHQAEEDIEKIEEELKILLIPKDPHDDKNVIVEIRGAAGGDEANIFAGDLLRMYMKYAELRNWKVEMLDVVEGAAGGFAQVSFSVSGDNVYSFLKYESGPHRVQRVPATESQGRIHTSTATVLVMPEADEVEVDLNLADCRIDVYCSSGPGGQSVNTTKSAVRITHVPTGLVASCQDGKSQHENKASALKILKARLLDKISTEKAEKEGQERLSKIGRGDRSEKIRTYNYPQNRVTDHRIGFTIQQLDRVMEGKLDPVIEALVFEDQKRSLAVKE